MKGKQIIILITIFMLFCASCAKAQTLGSGISVDSQENLVINAPLYVFDRHGENPKLEKAPTSINSEVSVSVYSKEERDIPLKFSGEIKNGFLSLTINKPDELKLYEAKNLWLIPESFFTNGANVKIAELSLRIDNENDFYLIWLYPNINVKILQEPYSDTISFFIDDEHYKFIYSLGEINISGKFFDPNHNWQDELNIYFKQGWNIVSIKKYYDYTLKREILIMNSVILSKNAVWVLY